MGNIRGRDMIKRENKRRMKLTKDKTSGLFNFMDYRKRSNKIVYFVMLFLLVIFCFVAIIPVFWLVINAFKSASQFNDPKAPFFPIVWNFAAIGRLFTEFNFGSYYLVTLIVVLLSILFSLVFNGLMAYVTGVLKPKGYKIIHYAIFVSYMIPSMLSIVPLFEMITKIYGALNIYGKSPIHFLTVTLCFGSNAYYYMLLKDQFEKIPTSLIEASKIDGMSDLQIFFRVILPLSKPTLGVVAIFTMTAAYSDFLLPYLVLYGYGGETFSTLMVEIFNLQSSNSNITTPEILMAILFSIIPQLVMFIIFQKQIMNSNVKGGMKE